MNEENKNQDDGYQEIDVSKPQQEEPEKEYEVEEATEESKEQPKVETKKEETEESIDSKLQEIETKEINSKLENEKVDVTLPEREFSRGKIHPVSQVIDEISSIFSEIGFSVEEGPDIENEHYNFTAIKYT